MENEETMNIARSLLLHRMRGGEHASALASRAPRFIRLFFQLWRAKERNNK